MEAQGQSDYTLRVSDSPVSSMIETWTDISGPAAKTYVMSPAQASVSPNPSSASQTLSEHTGSSDPTCWCEIRHLSIFASLDRPLAVGV